MRPCLFEQISLAEYLICDLERMVSGLANPYLSFFFIMILKPPVLLTLPEKINFPSISELELIRNIARSVTR